VRQKFSHLKPKQNGFKQATPQTFSKIVTRNKKSLEQVQICMGVPALQIADERRYAAYVLNTLLGGGMSSRLFQNIRENQGLCYAIYSDLNSYRDTGCLSVCAGTSQEWAPKVVESVVGEFRNLKEQPVAAEEVSRAKAQLKGSLMLSLESSSARMSNLARQEMYFDRFFSLDEIIERIENVSADQLQEMSQELFHPDKIAVTVLGNLDGLKITPEQLAC
jgi:predicted Zn-dependent peptidase